MRPNDTVIARSKAKALAVCFLGLTVASFPRAGFTESCDRVSALERYADDGVPPQGAICETYVGAAGAKGVSCRWEFQYRDIQAVRTFDDFWTEITGCRDGTRLERVEPVNHPDTYLQREFLTSNGLYRVSQKDKGEIKRTLVFLSFEHDS